MAQQISIGLYAEGATDHAYLGPLIEFVMRDILSSNGIDRDVHPVARIVEPGELFAPYPEDVAVRWNRMSFEERLAAMDQFNQHTIIVVHRDADAPSIRASKIYQSTLRRVPDICASPDRWVLLIPVRETEAWQIADKDLLAKVCRVTRAEISNAFAGQSPENIADPKALRNALLRQGHGRRVRGVERRLARPDLAAMRRMTSFNSFEDGLKGTLRHLGARL